VEKIENGDLTRYYYDSLSRLKTAILPDHTIQNYEFDDLNNIKAMAEITKITNSQSLIKETTYRYDRNSRLLLAETIAGNQTEQQRFTYDKEGNQLSKEENTKYQGNQIASKEYTYQYNGYNQLSRVIDSNQKIIEYTYNGAGLRTKKDFIGQAIQYYYNGQNIILETDQNNRITAKNIRGIQLISRQTDTQSFYYLHNAHGDVTALTDKFGKVIKDYGYDPYGNEKTNPINLFGKNATTELWRQEVEQVDNPFRYCGEYLDEETGNIYLRARYYDPGLGRFTQEDGVKGSLGNPFSLNLYAYCYNNPINYFDPTGLSASTAEWSDNQYSYLSFLASGTDGNAEWARQQLSTLNCFIDEDNDVYSNDEVLRARYPEWYQSDSNTNSSNTSSIEVIDSSETNWAGLKKPQNYTINYVNSAAKDSAMYGVDGVVEEGAKLFGRTVSSQFGNIYSGITTAIDVNDTIENNKYTTKQKALKVTIQFVGGAANVAFGTMVTGIVIGTAAETGGLSIIGGAVAIGGFTYGVNKTQNWLYKKIKIINETFAY